jgi:glutathione S-transferase
MKLYTSHGPNPRVVDRFLAEKDVRIPTHWVDIMVAENRRDPYLSEVNPAGTIPALQLDDGTHVSDVIAICEYLDERFPDRPLIGRTPEKRALSRMWTRRVDLMVCEPLANGYRFDQGLAIFSNRMRCLPEAAAGLKAVARDGLQWFEAHFEGPWLSGVSFTLADIMLATFVDFGNEIARQPLPLDLRRLQAWLSRVHERLGVTNFR